MCDLSQGSHLRLRESSAPGGMEPWDTSHQHPRCWAHRTPLFKRGSWTAHRDPGKSSVGRGPQSPVTGQGLKLGTADLKAAHSLCHQLIHLLQSTCVQSATGQMCTNCMELPVHQLLTPFPTGGSCLPCAWPPVWRMAHTEHLSVSHLSGPPLFPCTLDKMNF